MSVKIMSWVFDHSPYSGKAQMIHLALADHADDDGRCWPGNERVAKKARATTQYVRVTINAMVVAGLAEELDVGGGKGRTKQLRLLGPWNQTPNSVAPTRAIPQTPASDTPNSDEITPYIEPSIEPSRAAHEPLGFSAWYAFYPRRVGRGKALTAYRAACKLASEEELLLGLKAQVDELRSRETRYIPHPASWLNGQRWLDEAPAPMSSQQKRDQEYLEQFA